MNFFGVDVLFIMILLEWVRLNEVCFWVLKMLNFIELGRLNVIWEMIIVLMVLDLKVILNIVMLLFFMVLMVCVDIVILCFFVIFFSVGGCLLIIVVKVLLWMFCIGL